MQPDQVPGVHQLAAGGVRRVMRIGPFVVIDHDARRRAALCVGVSIRLVAELIAGHIGLYGLG